MMNKKHAYLIMAHNNFSQLQTLISLLDHPQNDIYLHVDKKSMEFQPERIKVNHSGLVIVKRIRVNWGGHSQIECELNLLKASVGKNYQYYHLLSGVDLPLKTQDEIHAFFDEGYPKNYIRFNAKAFETGSFLQRIRYYHFLHDHIGRNRGTWIAVLKRIEKRSLHLQKKMDVQRKQYITPYKGSNWFSITHEFAKYVLTQEKLIRKQFYYSICADEIFLNSLIMASPYKETVVDDDLRAIDWERGIPYTYREEDVDELLSSGKLFARKFDENIDGAAIEKVIANLTRKA